MRARLRAGGRVSKRGALPKCWLGGWESKLAPLRHTPTKQRLERRGRGEDKRINKIKLGGPNKSESLRGNIPSLGLNPT